MAARQKDGGQVRPPERRSRAGQNRLTWRMKGSAGGGLCGCGVVILESVPENGTGHNILEFRFWILDLWRDPGE